MSRPDEGLIHAWLDDELDAAEGARVEALVRDDPEWAAAAAEARGLIAAGARIIGALDDVPAGVIPETRTPSSANVGASSRRTVRATPWWRMRVAALLVIAVGTTLVLARSTPENEMALEKTAQTAASADRTQSATSARVAVPPPDAAPEQDRARAASPEPVRGRVPLAAPRAAVQGPPQVSVQGAQQALTQGAPQALQQRTRLADTRDLKDAPVRREAIGVEKSVARPDSARAAQNAAEAGARGQVVADSLAKKLAASNASLGREVVAGVQTAPQRARAAGAGGVAATDAGKMGADVAFAAREECYRERGEVGGTSPMTFRVLRTGDSTATPAPASPTPAADEFRRAVAAPPVPFTVRGDTLFVRASGAAVRVALRVICPTR